MLSIPIISMDNYSFIIKPATEEQTIYASVITDEMEQSAKARGTGIAKRSPEYIITKMMEGKAVIDALTPAIQAWAGCKP